MWHNLKLEGQLSKVAAEFTIWMIGVLPHDKMKIRIYEPMCGKYEGFTDLLIKRKYDGEPEGAIGIGVTIEGTLASTIKYFNEMLKEDGITKLSEDDIEYVEYFNW